MCSCLKYPPMEHVAENTGNSQPLKLRPFEVQVLCSCGEVREEANRALYVCCGDQAEKSSGAPRITKHPETKQLLHTPQ